MANATQEVSSDKTMANAAALSVVPVYNNNKWIVAVLAPVDYIFYHHDLKTGLRAWFFVLYAVLLTLNQFNLIPSVYTYIAFPENVIYGYIHCQR